MSSASTLLDGFEKFLVPLLFISSHGSNPSGKIQIPRSQVLWQTASRTVIDARKFLHTRAACQVLGFSGARWDEEDERGMLASVEGPLPVTSVSRTRIASLRTDATRGGATAGGRAALGVSTSGSW